MIIVPKKQVSVLRKEVILYFFPDVFDSPESLQVLTQCCQLEISPVSFELAYGHHIPEVFESAHIVTRHEHNVFQVSILR